MKMLCICCIFVKKESKQKQFLWHCKHILHFVILLFQLKKLFEYKVLGFLFNQIKVCRYLNNLMNFVVFKVVTKF